MNKKPFFSVVIPTRNKAAYLPIAIQSTLNQTFKDFEIIVNDNFSSDNTEEIAKSFDDDRIKYFKTTEALPMNESWKNALSRAEGEYITFLGDDDAHSHIFLERMKEIIDKNDARMICSAMGEYTHDAAYAFETNLKPNTLVVSAFTNQLAVYDSREAISSVYAAVGLVKERSEQPFHCPQLINAVYHQSLFTLASEKVREIFPNVLSTDFYVAIITLSVVDKFYVLDAPLSFHGLTNKSTTASIAKSLGGGKMKDSQPEMTNIKHAPLKIVTIPTFVTDALIKAKTDLKDELDFIKIDLTAYLAGSYETLNKWEAEGLDVSSEKAELSGIIAEQPIEIQRAIDAALSLKSKIKNSLYYQLRTVQRTALYDLFVKLYPRRTRRRLFIDGSRYGFSNLTDCSKMIGHEFLEKNRSNTSRF